MSPFVNPSTGHYGTAVNRRRFHGVGVIPKRRSTIPTDSYPDFGMRDAQGFAPPGAVVIRPRRIAPALLAVALLAAAASYVVPRGLDANTQLAIEDDPSQIASRALDEKFDSALAQ